MIPHPVFPPNIPDRSLKKCQWQKYPVVLIIVLLFCSSLAAAAAFQVSTTQPVNKSLAAATTTPVQFSTTTAPPVQTPVRTTVPVQTALRTTVQVQTLVKTTVPAQTALPRTTTLPVVPLPTTARAPLPLGTAAPAITFQTARTTAIQTAATPVICQSGQGVCNGQCIDITSDSANCGGCGNRCAVANTSCYQRHCWGACTGTQGPVNFNTDPLNCGQCGNVCPYGQVCWNWQCKDNITGGWDTLCESPDYYSPPQYTNLRSDPRNCGRCGNDCGENGYCVYGSCTYACTNPDGTIDHPNFYTNNRHCGRCGNACGEGAHCMEGQCMQNCLTSEYRRCPPDNSCTKIDEQNCHACGEACGANETCAYNPYSSLHYYCRCLPGYNGVSGGGCMQFGTPEHCEGQYGTACPPGFRCLLTGSIFTGRCLPSCPTGYEDCGGTCRDPKTDPDNCGSCGNACGANQYCTDGTCHDSCPAGTRICTEYSTRKCVNVTTDPFNCGSCGNDCGTARVCVNGACQDTCPLGPADGGATCRVNGRLVCVDLRLDNPLHCGNCSNVCLADQWCEDGVCDSCGADEIYCAGQCQNVRSRGACGGTCSNHCGYDRFCYNGECRAACPQGYTSCYNGMCVDLQADSGHCGQCGHVCTGGSFCHAGQCVTQCPQWTTRCGDRCVGLGIDKYNCGSCGHVCEHMCVLGVCI